MTTHTPLPWLPLAAFLLVTLGLYAWGAWVARRRATLLYRLAARGILLGAVFTLLGAALVMNQLSAAAHAALGPSQDANAYAQAVSGAFAIAALPIGIGNFTLLASVVVLVIGTIRRPAAA